jgi:hypothetical protein
MLTTNTRPKTIIVILAMLLVLAVVSAVSMLTSRIGFSAPRANRTGSDGTTPSRGQANNNGIFQGNTGNTQGDEGNTQGNNRNFQGRANQGGFNLFSLTRTLGLSPQVMVYFNIGLPIAGIALLLASAFGVWKKKGWGLNLATLLALIFLLAALPGFFSLGGRNINWLRTGLNALSGVATLPILALSFLPSVRDYFPKPVRKAKAK